MAKLRFKDWKKGEARVNIEVVTETGGKIKAYLPHLHPKDGEAFIALTIEAANEETMTQTQLGKSVLRIWKRILKKREKDGEK
jgi:hypothetical protein